MTGGLKKLGAASMSQPVQVFKKNPSAVQPKKHAKVLNKTVLPQQGIVKTQTFKKPR